MRKTGLYVLLVVLLLATMAIVAPFAGANQLAGPVAPGAQDVAAAAGGKVEFVPGHNVPNAPMVPGAILFDNGPLVTHPGGGFGGADASAVQTAIGQTLYGAGHQLSANNRVADDFTVPAGETWTINTVTFYAYQTGSTTTSTMNHVNLRIWSGMPDVGSIVFGDTTTNRMASTSFTNDYRVLDTGLTVSNRPIMGQVTTVGTVLTAGTYWLDWQTGGTLASGPWAPPVSIVGQTGKPGANAMQSIAGAAFVALLDTTFPQDLPFMIEGSSSGGGPTPTPTTPPPPTPTPTPLPPRCPAGFSEVTLVNEGFEGTFPPAGWVVANSTSSCTGIPDWTNTDPGARGNLTGGSGLFAVADSDACGSGVAMNAQMWSPVLNLTGYTDPRIVFKYDYNDLGSADSGALDFSTDGGSNWSNITTWTTDDRGPKTYDGTFVSTSANTVIRWHYIAGWDWWWEVDDVAVTACQAPPTAVDLDDVSASNGTVTWAWMLAVLMAVTGVSVWRWRRGTN
ncbi:MAG: hypothetical protein WAV66_11020 [Anaerolineae bacterium]